MEPAVLAFFGTYLAIDPYDAHADALVDRRDASAGHVQDFARQRCVVGDVQHDGRFPQARRGGRLVLGVCLSRHHHGHSCHQCHRRVSSCVCHRASLLVSGGGKRG